MSDFINLKNFKKLIQEKNLEQKTVEGFWENFNSWKEEYPEEYIETFKQGFIPEKLFIYINTVNLTITNYPDEDFNHVVIRLNFEYDDSSIGEYRMVFDYETGEVFDDIFSVY